MSHMTSQDIIQSIANWTAILENGKELGKILEQGNCFLYPKIVPGLPSQYIHAYPGIFEGHLKFFLIPEAFDKDEYKDVIDLHTHVCPVSWSLFGSHTIPDLVAEARINRWITHYKSWSENQSKEPNGMFRAFGIPAEDVVAGEVLITLGLELGGVEGAMTADLIVANVGTKALIEFDDYVQPVPPYSSTLLEGSFYLLNAQV